jgi:predicted ATP-binding protein involved in virulence
VKTKFENTTALNLDKSVLNTFDRVIEKHEKNLPVFLYVGTEYIHQPHAKTDTLKEDGSALQGYWYCFEEKSMESYVFDWLKKMNETREEQKEKINASILYDELPSIFLNNFEYIIQQIFPDEIVSVQWIKNFKERQTRGKIDGKKIATQHSIDYILTFGFKNGEVRTYEMLSDGYRYLVLLAGELITRCVLLNKHLKDRVAFKTNGIVLIDEFGIHLHPELQTAALNRICTTFPNIQFIITTHSPLLLNNLKREQVHILEIDENNNRTIKNPDNDIVGLGAEGILKELFGLPTTLDTTSQKWASDYKELFLTKNEGLQLSVEQSKLFKELEAKLMTIDPGIIIKTAEDPLYTRFKERLNELESFHLTKQNGLSNDEMDKILSNIISSK